MKTQKCKELWEKIKELKERLKSLENYESVFTNAKTEKELLEIRSSYNEDAKGLLEKFENLQYYEKLLDLLEKKLIEIREENGGLNVRVNPGGFNDFIEILNKSNLLYGITTLKCFTTNIGDEGAKSIAASKTLVSLVSLDLGWEHIGDEGVKSIVGSANMRNLRILDLTHNRIGREGTKAIAGSANMGNLTHLIFGLSAMGAEARKYLDNAKGKTLRQDIIISVRLLN